MTVREVREDEFLDSQFPRRDLEQNGAVLQLNYLQMNVRSATMLVNGGDGSVRFVPPN